MKQHKKFRTISKTLLLFTFFILFGVFHKVKAQEPSSNEVKEKINGTIIEVLEEKEINEEAVYQKLRVKLSEGREITVENDPQTSAKNILYKKGDKVILQKLPSSEADAYVITDFNRRSYLLFIFILFSALAIVIARKKGFYSLVGMGISFLVIFKFILPQIAAGRNPLLITVVASLLIIPLTFYLSHGINKKTHISIISTIIILTVTAVFTAISISAAKLTGYASEEALFLQLANQTINMKGLLLAGIIIGFLGILDDVTVSQANVVLKLKKASPNLGTLALYARAMEIGRDHIASMVNTLVLVYAGASLPLLLMFTNDPQPFGEVINREIIADEIVRTLLGSIGLILAVPLTTFIASLVADIE